MNGIKSALLGVVLTSWTSYALADNTSGSIGSGVIHFQGAIVEAGCDITFQQSLVSTACFRQGKNTRTTSDVTANKAIPAALGTSEVKWLNPQHTQGVVTLSYN
ncbi:hypothetical protein [Erwinia sp. E_sp_B04_7]|uniref:hypothetical protein n=1 Tax=unclassified Erwinia TaxID=2622719 RepID=UPI0030CB07EF